MKSWEECLGEFKAPWYTASQTNREGYGAEVANVNNISEAFNKVFICDLVCCLSRTLEDKRNNTGRMLIAKNRLGRDGILLPMTMDLSCLNIQIHDNKNETIEQVEQISSTEQLKRLKQKYQEYKQKQEK